MYRNIGGSTELSSLKNAAKTGIESVSATDVPIGHPRFGVAPSGKVHGLPR
jgi:hypothetical protein